MIARNFKKQRLEIEGNSEQTFPDLKELQNIKNIEFSFNQNVLLNSRQFQSFNSAEIGRNSLGKRKLSLDSDNESYKRSDSISSIESEKSDRPSCNEDISRLQLTRDSFEEYMLRLNLKDFDENDSAKTEDSYPGFFIGNNRDSL